MDNVLSQDTKSEVDQACQTATDFTKHYYDSLDKRRHLIARLYMDSAILVWNGNGFSGKEEIQKFLSGLPSCDHVLSSMDSQKVIESAVGKKLAYVIEVQGNVRYDGKSPRQFQQNFIITAEGDKWKIVSDCFRFQEPVPP